MPGRRSRGPSRARGGALDDVGERLRQPGERDSGEEVSEALGRLAAVMARADRGRAEAIARTPVRATRAPPMPRSRTSRCGASGRARSRSGRSAGRPCRPRAGARSRSADVSTSAPSARPGPRAAPRRGRRGDPRPAGGAPIVRRARARRDRKGWLRPTWAVESIRPRAHGRPGGARRAACGRSTPTVRAWEDAATRAPPRSRARRGRSCPAGPCVAARPTSRSASSAVGAAPASTSRRRSLAPSDPDPIRPRGDSSVSRSTSARAAALVKADSAAAASSATSPTASGDVAGRPSGAASRTAVATAE